MRYFLRHIAQMPLPVALMVAVGALCMWIIDYVHVPSSWVSILATQMAVVFNGLLLSMLFYKAKVSHHLSFLPLVLYILSVALLPALRVHWQWQILVFDVLVFVYMMQNKEHAQEPIHQVFAISLLLAVTSAVIPDALWLIPYVWVVVLLSGDFTLRTILASVLAIGCFAVYYGIVLYFSEMHGVVDYSMLYVRGWVGNFMPVCMQVVLWILIVASAGFSLSALSRSSYDLVSVRMMLFQQVVLFVVILPFVLLVPDVSIGWDSMHAMVDGLSDAHVGLLSLLPLSVSSIGGIFFMQKQSEARGITLLVYFALSVGLYVWLALTL